MPKSTTRPAYRCTECGWEANKWVGRCGECQAWGSVAEAAAPTMRASAGPVTAPAVRTSPGRESAPVSIGLQPVAPQTTSAAAAAAVTVRRRPRARIRPFMTSPEATGGAAVGAPSDHRHRVRDVRVPGVART